MRAPTHLDRLEAESIDILRQAWSSHTPFSYHGKRFHFDNVMLTPKPYQPGGPPLWIGAAYDEAIRLDPNLKGTWNNKGNALVALGRTTEAEAAFARARELGSN